VTQAIGSFGPVTEQAVAKMLKQCGEATAEQVLKAVSGIEVGDSIRNPVGFLLDMVPAYLRGEYKQRGSKKDERSKLAWEVWGGKK
jgi:hypothetical protein